MNFRTTKPRVVLFQILFLVLILPIIITSCGDDGTVHIVYKDFGEEVSTTQNLTIEFNQEVANPNQLNRWDSTAYIQFEPEIKGAFNWESTSRLVFSPANQLPPATTIKGTVSKAILTGAKDLKLGDDISFTFSTKPLTIQEISAYYSRVNRGSKDDPNAFVELTFNFPVPVQEVENRLKLQLGLDLAGITMETEDKFSRKVLFYADRFELVDQTFPITVTVGAGITPFGGAQTTTKELKVQTNLSSPFNFKVKSISSLYNGSEGVVDIVTTQAPQADDFKKFLSINPKIDFKLERKSNGFQLVSEDFQISQKYEVIVKKGLEGEIGGVLRSEYRQDISFGNVQPTIKFAGNKSRFLSKQGFKNVKIQILNVPEVELVVYKLYENNALNFLSSRNYYYDYNTDEYTYGYNYGNTNQYDEVWKETVTTGDLAREGNYSILNLDFEDKLKDFKGIFIIQVKSTENQWLKDSRVISISDLGLIAKNGRNRTYVFVNSLETASPVTGAQVTLIGTNNQKLQTVITNGQGAAIFELDPNMPSGFDPQMVVVQQGEDYNLMDFMSTAIQTSRFDVGGKYLYDRKYEGFVFMERDLYRPGETANFAVIVRDRDWGLPGEIPIKIKVRTPDGRDFISIQKVLSQQGFGEASIALPIASLTGNYSMSVYTSNDQFLVSKNLKVEEFLPDRIKVNSNLDKKEYLSSDDNINLEIKAVNFFGPPAANKSYQVRMQWERRSFWSKKFRNYSFSYHELNTPLYDVSREGTTNDAGAAYENIRIPEFSNNGLINLTAFVTVFDETGRPVSVVNRAKIFTQDVFYGIRSADYWVKTGSLVKSDLIALDKDENVLNDKKARVKIVKHEYKTVLTKSGSYYRYRSQKYERTIEDKQVVFSGQNTSISFIPDLSGRYEVRIYPPGSKNYIAKSFYAYGYGATNANSFEVNTEGEVDIILDKEGYATGETAKVLINTPFNGTALITVESNEVKDYFYVQTENRSAQFDLSIKDTYLPNVFVSATLFKPQKESEIPLTVAHGYALVKADDPGNKLEVAIEAVEKSRSNQTQRISVITQPNAMVGLAVVDEGILQVAKYKTPSPYDFFYGKRALEVDSYDLYPYLFPEIAGNLPGGGAELESQLSSRINPLNNKRVKLVSYWNGIKQADGSGSLDFDIEIPQFSGDLRVMAIAFNDQSFGNGQRNMKVSDPIVISPGIPRFLSPQDTLQMSVAISNTTSKGINAEVTIDAKGQVNTIGTAAGRETLDAGKEKSLSYELAAKNEIGQGEIEVKVKDGGDEYLNTTSITIRPNVPLVKTTGSGVINDAATRQVTMEVEKYIPSTVKRKLIVSKSPMTEFSSDLNYLLRYPYGCIEQTTSRGFPLLYYTEITGESADKNQAGNNANYIVNEVIKRLYLMQLYNGGFAYWPGQGNPSLWGSAYATHFLVEARRAGYSVNSKVLKKALDFLKKKANEKKVIDYYYTYTSKRAIYPRSSIYSLYILALAGEPQRSTMNFYYSKQGSLTSDSKYLLAAAYSLTGDRQRGLSFLPSDFSTDATIKSSGGSFYSPLRDEAIALASLLDADPTHSQIPVMAKHVADALKSRRWYNTQERAFSLVALGRIAKQAANSNITATVSGPNGKIGEFENTKEPLELAGENLTGNINIQTQGEGTLYYFWETEGISKDGSYEEEDNYLKIRRTFLNEGGGTVDLSNVKQNDRIVVRLTLQNAYGTAVENIVVTDMLPACFEVENPRFGELPEYRWIKDSSTPDHSDFRDDRVHLFTDLYTGQKRVYYYMVRAVSKGKFQLGPVAADAMYNNEYHSYHGGGEVIVK